MSGNRWTPMPEPLLDFRKFLYLVWKHLNLPDPTPVQYDIALWLMHGPRRKIIQAFRGVGKSWITSAYVVWRLRVDPQLKFLVVSASKDRSDSFSTFTLRLIREMPILRCLIPSTTQRDSKIAFDVGPARADHAPSVKSVGIFGQLAGTRADEIVADDVEVPNNAFTQGMRDKLSEAVKEFDAILKPDGKITYLGTPQTEESLYNVLPERGYSKRIWPARFPDEERLNNYGEFLAPYVLELINANPVHGPVDPDRFDEVDLMEREASYGRSGFSLQFMLDTRFSDAERFPLKLADLVVMDLDLEIAPEKVAWASGPDRMHKDLQAVGFTGDHYHGPMYVAPTFLPYQGAIMAIDPSGRGKDETAYAVVKMLNGQLFVTDAGGLKGGYDDETLTKLAHIAQEHSVNRILVESNFGDGMFTALLKPHLKRIYPCTTEEVRHNTQKENRIIDTLEPVMNQHRLIVNKSIIQKDIESTKELPVEKQLYYQLFYQMTRITRERGALAHDDRLDALAIAVAFWTERMAQDADFAVEQRKEELMEFELAVYRGDIDGGVDAIALGATSCVDSLGKGHSWNTRRKARA